MSNQTIQIGDFGLVIPDEKMFDVATLKIDLRPSIRALQEASGNPKEALEVVTRKFTCRKGCGKQFTTLKFRRRHERTHHE